MKDSSKILIFSFVGGVIVILVSLVLVFLNFLDPFANLDLVFAKFGQTPTYDYSTFGLMFQVWTTTALLPITGQNLFNSVFSLEALLPLVLFFIISLVMGYLLKLPNGISASLLVIFWTMVISMIFAFIMPHTLPSIGLSPSDLNYLKGLADELIFFTILTPPNMLEGTIITLGTVLLGGGIGGLVHKVTHPAKPSKKSKSKK